jgi:hypothetical protein
MKKAISIDEVQALKEQLAHVRQQSLAAARQNDFRAVARLTCEAARLNRAIHTQEDFAGNEVKSLAIVDALAHLDDEGRFDFPPETTVPMPAPEPELEAA